MSTYPSLEARISAQEQQQVFLHARIEQLSQNTTTSIKQLSDNIDTRFKQLSDDVAAHFEHVTGNQIKAEQQTVARLNNIETRLDKLETRLDKLETRFDKLETLLTQILARLPERSS
ncbi:MAG: hypothetical protein IMW89_16550 [Ktedonobacteraceae bacterium]|nr:hypothetical protein [Ktedonobacteraceae bacterium]MBE3560810.1 hypothetical protein [Ktedonobacteraceae bacterium]